MKIGIFSDTHLGAYGDKVDPSSGLNARLEDYTGTLEKIIEDMRNEYGVDMALFGGDMFKDKSGKPNPTQLVKAGRALKLLGPYTPLHMITGNHDLPRASGESDALSCFQWLDGVKVHRKPTLFNDGNVQIIFLPYPNRNAFMADERFKNMSIHEANETIQVLLIQELHSLASQLNPELPSILLAHVALAESKAGSENMMMMGRDICLSVSDIPNNILYRFFGHIHKPQELQINCDVNYVIGSPESVDFGEEGESKRWLLLNTDAGTVESIPTCSRQYITYDYNTIEGDRHIFLADHVKDSIVRIRITMRKNQQVDIQGMRNKLMDAGAFSVKFEREYVSEERDTSAVDSVSVESQTQEDILKEYCTTKNITGNRASNMINTGLAIMQEESEKG